MHRRIGAVAVAGLVTVAACASRDGRAHAPMGETVSPPPGVVAWVDRPAVPYVEPTPTPPHFPTDARSCPASDLIARSGDVGPTMGTTNIRIEFTNQATTPCVLLGRPTIAGIAADGNVTALNVGLGSNVGDAPWPAANIATGETAAVNVSASDWCDTVQNGEHRAYPKLRIGLPSGESIDVRGHGFDTICGVRTSRFGVPADSWPPREPPSPLVAHLTVPTTAHPGEDVRYTVTLHNQGNTPYELTPCPAYEEYLTTSEGFVHPNYYLNCDEVKEIEPGASETYAMQLQLPADLERMEFAKFGWHLQGDVGPSAATILTISN